jgi:hypothetical protein
MCTSHGAPDVGINVGTGEAFHGAAVVAFNVSRIDVQTRQILRNDLACGKC